MDKRNATLKIALAQMTVTHGEVAPNLATICRMTAEAAQAGAQIVCFPELAQCGFYMKQNIIFICCVVMQKRRQARRLSIIPAY